MVPYRWQYAVGCAADPQRAGWVWTARRLAQCLQDAGITVNEKSIGNWLGRGQVGQFQPATEVDIQADLTYAPEAAKGRPPSVYILCAGGVLALTFQSAALLKSPA